jgi:hypothetical protein
MMKRRATSSVLTFILAAVLAVAYADDAHGQITPRPVPPTITITPAPSVPVSVLPGGIYTIELRPSLPDVGRPINVTTTAPGVRITPLPDGPGGEIRMEVEVAATAPGGPATVQVTSEGRLEDLPLIVAPPPPPSAAELDHPHGESSDDEKKLKDQPTGLSAVSRFVIVFAVGLIVGVVVARRKRAR